MVPYHTPGGINASMWGPQLPAATPAAQLLPALQHAVEADGGAAAATAVVGVTTTVAAAGQVAPQDDGSPTMGLVSVQAQAAAPGVQVRWWWEFVSRVGVVPRSAPTCQPVVQPVSTAQEV